MDSLSNLNLTGSVFAYAGRQIPAEADLDDYTECNKYYCGYTNTQTLANCPITTAVSFSMYVLYQAPSTNGNVFQLIVSSTTSELLIYGRLYVNGTFRDWHSFDVTKC